MLKNSLIIILIVLISFVPSVARGQTQTSTIGSFTLLNKNDKAPFAGTLLDPTSTAIVLIEQENHQKETEMRLKFLEEKLTLKFQFEINALNSQLKTKDEEYKAIIKIKDEQIKKTEDLLKGGLDLTWVWVGLGFIAGALVGIGGIALYERLK